MLPAAAMLTRSLGALAYYIASCAFLLWLCRFWTRFTLQPGELADKPAVGPGWA